VLDYFPADHPKRPEIIAILDRLAVSVTPYQDEETGLWYQVMDQGTRKGNYLEATVSSMFAYAFVKGAKKGYLNPKYMDVAKKAYQGLIDHLIEIGPEGEVIITQCCSVAGLGGDPYRDGSYEYYVSEPIRSNDPKAVGPFILASLEFEEAKVSSR
jgi:unsaturated rhamnogalacturonyl hydrolase